MKTRSNRETRAAIQSLAAFQRVAVLVFTILCVVIAVPAFGVIYEDGPTDGTTNAFYIDGPGPGPFSQTISDGFFPQHDGNALVLQMVMWVPTGSVPVAGVWSLGTSPFGSDLGGGSGVTGETYLFTNGFGYDVFDVTFSMGGLPMSRSNFYWLTMSNANDSSGGQMDAWDMNGGPAICQFAQAGNDLGDCGAGGESFTINPGGSPTPEPNSLLMLGSGVLSFGALLRRRFLG